MGYFLGIVLEGEGEEEELRAAAWALGTALQNNFPVQEELSTHFGWAVGGGDWAARGRALSSKEEGQQRSFLQQAPLPPVCPDQEQPRAPGPSQRRDGAVPLPLLLSPLLHRGGGGG